MKIRSFLLLIFFSLVSCSVKQSDTAAAPDNGQAVAITSEQGTQNAALCDVIKSPEKYERKLVRVKGIYCDCAENSQIYSPACKEQKKVWVQGSLGRCKNAGRIDDFRSTSKNEPERMWGSWTFGVVAEGRLVGTKGGYGHMNQYDYVFEIDCLNRAERLDDGKANSEKLEQKIQEFEESN